MPGLHSSHAAADWASRDAQQQAYAERGQRFEDCGFRYPERDSSWAAAAERLEFRWPSAAEYTMELPESCGFRELFGRRTPYAERGLAAGADPHPEPAGSGQWHLARPPEEDESQVRRGWEEACRRSRDLLLSFLSEQQRADYEGRGFFLVKGSSGRTWRIRAGCPVGNVELMSAAGHPAAAYCAHPLALSGAPLPDCDVHLAQMLALVTDEQAFLDVANIMPARFWP